MGNPSQKEVKEYKRQIKRRDREITVLKDEVAFLYKTIDAFKPETGIWDKIINFIKGRK